MAKKSYWNTITSAFREILIGKPEIDHFESYYNPPIETFLKKRVDVPGQVKPVPLPTSRSSMPHQPVPVTSMISTLGAQYRTVNHGFVVQVIPLIRALMKMNPDVGQAIHNIIALGNTGHKVMFDRAVPPEMVDEMRNHLENQKLVWSAGCAGMDGLINKMFAQILVGGALSNEWVPNKKLTGVETCILVNPEDITFVLEEGNIKYTPYQRIVTSGGYADPLLKTINPQTGGLIPLNKYTYRYYGLNGDTEIPYGFPPYMAAVERIRTQVKMQTNIDYVVDQMGILGFLEVLVDQPDQEDGESTQDYGTRLDQLLDLAKQRIASGMKDGVVVGFREATEFKFNSLGKAVKEAIEMFQNNELMLASGLKMDASLLGRAYSTTETQITVVFMKMLSELRNIQNIVKHNLQFGYALDLTLAGFKFDYLKVVFNRSTLQDDLKYQQAEEIKLRNVTTKQLWGYINQEQAADELGYERPAETQALVDYEILAGGSTPLDESAGDTKRQKGKDSSDKKVRDKNKPVSKSK